MFSALYVKLRIGICATLLTVGVLGRQLLLPYLLQPKQVKLTLVLRREGQEASAPA